MWVGIFPRPEQECRLTEDCSTNRAEWGSNLGYQYTITKCLHYYCQSDQQLLYCDMIMEE